MRIEDALDPRLDVQTSACLRLWAQVFEIGLIDAAWAFEFLQKTPTPVEPDDYYTEARITTHWFNTDAMHIGSFVWLCHLFGLDENIVRSKARGRFHTLSRRRMDVGKAATKPRNALEEGIPDTGRLPEGDKTHHAGPVDLMADGAVFKDRHAAGAACAAA